MLHKIAVICFRAIDTAPCDLLQLLNTADRVDSTNVIVPAPIFNGIRDNVRIGSHVAPRWLSLTDTNNVFLLNGRF